MQTTAGKPEAIQPLFTGDDVRRFHEVVRKVPVAEDLVRYAVRLASASRPHQAGAARLRRALGQLGGRTAGRPVYRAGCEGPRPAAGPRPRDTR